MAVPGFSLRDITPIVIGGLGIYIGWRQWRTNRHKVKLDLFDRRFRVYLCARKFIKRIYTKMGVSDEARKEYLHDLSESEFLFKKKLTRFLRDLLRKANELNLTRNQLRMAIDAANTDKRTESRDEVIWLSDKETMITNWITAEEGNLAKRFLPYLNFRNIK